MKRQAITLILSAVMLTMPIGFARAANDTNSPDKMMTDAYTALVAAESAAASGMQRATALSQAPVNRPCRRSGARPGRSPSGAHRPPVTPHAKSHQAQFEALIKAFK